MIILLYDIGLISKTIYQDAIEKNQERFFEQLGK
jgi:hypothetical protein